MRVHPAGPVRRWDIVLAVITGVLVAASGVQSFANNAGWTLSPLLIAALYAISVLAAVVVALTGAPQVMARKSQTFWGGGAFTRVLVAAAFYACASLVVSMALILLFATPPLR